MNTTRLGLVSSCVFVAVNVAAVEAPPQIEKFQAIGERWTCVVDGQPLNGVLLKPAGSGPFPAVILSHGLGGNAAAMAANRGREMLTRGYVVIATDYTHAGKPGAGRQARGEIDYSQVGASRENVRRALACLEILRRQPDVDPRRIFAHGHSMGAFLTIALVAATDKIAAAAITAGGIVPDGVNYAAPTVSVAGRVRTPMLILHGSADTTVPPARSVLLKEVLDKNNVPNDRIVFEGTGHNLPSPANAAKVYRLMHDWFTRHSAPRQAFQRTRVIGYSQVGQPRGGWFVTGGVFEAIVGNDRWELLWHGGAGVDKWRDPNYAGWSQPVVSPCPGNAPVDRVLLSVSGPFGDDEKAWADAIEATLTTIRQKIPTARQIILQAVVGGPEGKSCDTRAARHHPHIVNAIRAVAKKHAGETVAIVAGYKPRVRSCEDYADALGHLTPASALVVARSIGEYYAKLDVR